MIDQASKGEGVNVLQPDLPASSQKPLSVARETFYKLGGSIDTLGRSLCPKCAKRVKSVVLVTRFGKFKDWKYVQVAHWNPRNKKKKLSYCYLPVR